MRRVRGETGERTNGHGDGKSPRDLMARAGEGQKKETLIEKRGREKWSPRKHRRPAGIKYEKVKDRIEQKKKAPLIHWGTAKRRSSWPSDKNQYREQGLFQRRAGKEIERGGT